jgi:hypothetical protein
MKYIKTFETKKKELYKIENELINSVYHGNYAETKKLLDSGFDVNSKLDSGNNALLFAAYGGKWNIVYLLLKYDPDWYVKDNSGTDFIEYIEEHVGGDEVLEKIRKKYPEKYQEYFTKRAADKYNL